MSGTVADYAGLKVLVLDEAGGVIAREEDAGDVLGEAFAAGADWIAIPVGRLSEGFLDLKTRQMGLFLQKIVNYQRRVVFVGTISDKMAASGALRDFVRESNRGSQVWFVDSLPALEARFSS